MMMVGIMTCHATADDADRLRDFSISPPIPEPAIYPCILTWIQERLTSDTNAPFPTLADIYYSALGIPLAARTNDARWDSITPRTLTFLRLFRSLPPSWGASDLVEAMHKCGMDVGFLDTLPEAVLAPLQDAVCIVQVNPPISWPKDLLGLVNRGDITLVREPGKKPRIPHVNLLAPTHVATWDYQLLCQSVDDFNSVGYDEGEGTERQAVVRALFKDDRRLNEAQSLLSTHKAQVVRLDAQPSWSESYYLEKQKELVARMATGTLAIPAGRAMLYYGLRFPLLTQKFHIGGFNLSCVVKPTNVTVGVDRSLFTEEKVCWAFFHQGVAAGLAISPQAKGIDTSWILYNKPGQDLSNRHAGFLLALGLNGHLRSVAKWVAFKYLTPKHTMTSIGLLLGLAASYLGTMDSLVTRLLSVHVTRMLPRGAADLNLSPLTQTTGIMGIGLLYCSSQHRRMSEIMVSELEYIEEEDEEEPLRSECYRLAAGFALGFINLGRGADLRGLHDMKLTERLLTLASAPKKVEFVHVLDRSTAAATIAITLIFMKSEDQIVARKIDVPDSVLQFDYVRPDVLLLRTVAKNLILWSQITPTFDWIRDSLPGPYQHRHRNLSANARQKSRPARVTADIPFFSILAGLCLAIGLRFAGSADLRARDLLVHYLDAFMALAKPGPDQNSIPEGDEEAAAAVAAGGMPRHDVRAAVDCARNCQDVVALAAAAVMAGTGDLVVLRRLRSLHGRDHHPAPSELDAVNGAPDAGGNATTYGSHMAAHLAIGALFLGCGTATFGTSDLAVAALLAAFYPVFPTSVTDNQAHLQAFRHFWVLATDNRCLVTKDLSTGLPVSVPVEIRLKKTQRPDADKDAPAVLRRTTPCLLPPLETIENVRTDAGPAFWDLTIDFSSNRNDKDKLSTKSSKAHGASSTTREPQPPLDSFRITRPQQSVYLRRRPAREHPFAATLRALGHRGGAVTSRASKGGQIRASTGNPLEWVLSAAAPLRTLTHTERAIVLGADAATASVGTTPGGVPSSGGAGGGGAFGAGHTSGSEPAGAVGVASSTAVDARLVLETAVGGWRATGSASPGIHDDDGDSGGAGVGRHQSRPAVPLEASRDELLGLRLLFAWAEKRRERLLASSGTRAEEHDGTGDVDGGEQDGSGWWLRDSVVEMLKGRVWLAAREEDED